MYKFVMLIFIFAMGTIFGWCIEVLYRHFADPEKKWYNPGFCVGPWLPIYGVGLITAFLITNYGERLPIDNIIAKRIFLFFMTSVCMTIIELIGGEFLLKFFNLRLWDYRDEKFNYKGFICLKFSFYWMIISAVYYFLIHPYVWGSIEWLSKNLIFCFGVGMFFGVFILDLIYSGNVVVKLKEYAEKTGAIVKLEELKEKINREQQKANAKVTFFTLVLKENLANVLPKRENKNVISGSL